MFNFRLVFGWAPPQNHSSLDPVGVMAALVLVVELTDGELKEIFPETNNRMSFKQQDCTALPKVGGYEMKKVPQQEVIAKRYKCLDCNTTYGKATSLNQHNKFYHLGTKVC